MDTGIEALDQAYEVLFVAALIVLALLLIGCLVRAIMGPRVADRLVAVNMMGTIVMSIIAILTVRMGGRVPGRYLPYLRDVKLPGGDNTFKGIYRRIFGAQGA